jgi:hypothetical protein
MNDLFTHLIERARGTADVVLPRASGRFETSYGPAEAEWGEIRQQAVAPRPEPRGTARQRAQSVLARFEAETRAEAEPPRVAVRFERPPAGSGAAQTFEAAPGEAAGRRAEPAPVSGPVQQPAPAPRPRRPDLALFVTEPGAPPVAPASLTVIEERVPGAESGAATPPKASRPVVAAVLVPQAPPAVARETTPPAAAPPAIEVRIGRIEVKASPAAQPPRPVRKPPRLAVSLGDYLARKDRS